MTEKFPNIIRQEKAEDDRGINRRTFLKGLVGAAIASQIPDHFGATKEDEEMPKEKKEILELTADQEQEKKLEELRQKSFYVQFAKNYPTIYGDRLYTNEELLNPNFVPDQKPFFENEKNNPSPYGSPYKPGDIIFKPTPRSRFMQYFLRNGREQTFKAAEKLGCVYHQTEIKDYDQYGSIFADAGISLDGEKISWIEVPNGRSGSNPREGKMYGGKDENIMTVEAYNEEKDIVIIEPAKEAGYEVDLKKEHEGIIANEMMHEIQDRYFKQFSEGLNHKRLDEPFKSFSTKIPNLKFRNTAQAMEFLSDVPNWVIGGKKGVYFRFFNPLYYMDPNNDYYKEVKQKPEDDGYWYTYQVQKYAMEKVLQSKGFKHPKQIVDELIQEASTSDLEDHGDLFKMARKYFKEDDFEKIAEIYREIGVELLKKMKPYFSKN